MMKRGVVIVNTARGAVIDEAALVRALDSGHVASVGLDVYENEPDIHPGLIGNANVLMVPHLGTYTVEVSRLSPFLASRLPNVKSEMKWQCIGGTALVPRADLEEQVGPPKHVGEHERGRPARQLK